MSLVPGPRKEARGTIDLVGLSRLHQPDRLQTISQQWQAFEPLLEQLAPGLDPVTYGVICNSDHSGFHYLSAIERRDCHDPQDTMVTLRLEASTYRVFCHEGHVSMLSATCDAIWSDWLPGSDDTVVGAPWFERYGESFDPVTGTGRVEVWIPICS